MIYRFFQSSFWTQVITVTLLAFAAHIFMYNISLNIVMRDYCFGGKYFLDGVDPYKSTEPLGPNNSFKYSPLFALVAGGITKMMPAATTDMQSQVQTQGQWILVQSPGKPVQFYANSIPALVIGLWVLLSVGLFALGLRRWCDLSEPGPFCIILVFIAALLDVVISTGVYQINAIATGLLLLGLAEYRDGRLASSGALLVIAANLKIYPIIFLLALLLKFKWRFYLGVVCGGLAALFLPALFVGWTHNISTHIAWVQAVLNTAGSYRILDLVSSFERIGLPLLGIMLDKIVFVASLLLFYIYGVFSKKMDWRPWITFGIAAMLLVSPKTEVYTYVMLAPTYLFMIHWCREYESPFVRRFGTIVITLLSAAGASCRFTDPEWYRSESTVEIIRVLSALGFWIFSACFLVRTIYEQFLSQRQRASSVSASHPSGRAND